MKIYFAHSMKEYFTKKGKKEVIAISNFFKGSKIINPSELRSTNDMPYYFEKIDLCAIVVFSEYEGYIGKGVYYELVHAFNQEKPVWLLRDNKFYYIPQFSCNRIKLYDNGQSWVKYAKVVL